MNNIILTIGISGSGKSSWTNQHVLDNNNYRAVSRDKLRELAFSYCEADMSYYYSLAKLKDFEKYVSILQVTTIRQHLSQGFDVIIDNTHLDKRYIDDIIKEFPHCNVSFKVFDIELEEAIQRDSLRDRQVGEKVIKKQHEQLEKLKKCFDFKDIVSNFVKYIPDEFNPKAIICDLDGTIANYHETRPAYGFDPKLIRLDKPITPVVDLINSFFEQDYEILFLSGRDQVNYGETYNWLISNTKVVPQKINLWMRPTGDYRKDNIIKKQIFDKELKYNYNVKFAIDDRNSIVSLWQSLGIFVFNVNQSFKEF